MPEYVVKRVSQTLNTKKKSLLGSHILVLGTAYKKDVDDIRESPALEIIQLLKRAGADVVYHDPFVKELEYNGLHLKSIALTDGQIKKSDLVLILTNHTGIDYVGLTKKAKLVFDTRNVLGPHKNRSNVIRL